MLHGRVVRPWSGALAGGARVAEIDYPPVGAAWTMCPENTLQSVLYYELGQGLGGEARAFAAVRPGGERSHVQPVGTEVALSLCRS